MKIDKKLLTVVCCPETKQRVRIAENSLIEQLNQSIEKREIYNRINQLVEKTLDGGLIREDGKYLYPIIEEIPILLIDEAIPIDSLR